MKGFDVNYEWKNVWGKQFQVTLFFVLKALYYDFGETLPSNIGKKYEELIGLVSEYLDVDKGRVDIVKEQYYRKVVYIDQ